MARFSLTLAGIFFALAPGRAAEPPAKPNVLLIVADDLGWADVGYHGAKIKTPNIDRLVQTGVELDCHYVQPVCTPTRVALLTGRSPGRFGPHALSFSNLRALPPGTATLATWLRSAGYTTFLAGKWHLGSRAAWGPNEYGFDHTYGSLTGAADPWTHQYSKGPYAKTWHRDGKFFDEEGNATELIANQAVAWIKQKKTPWFIYVPFHAVHVPVDTPEEYKKPYRGQKFDEDEKKNESYQRYAAFVSQLDAKVGALIKALEDSGQRERTLVIFTSDNGGLQSAGNGYISQVPSTPLLSSNRPLRGWKATLYEGGVRVVAFANWPGVLQARKIATPLHAVDWSPTLTKLVGAPPKVAPHWDGRDIWPILTGELAHPEPRTIYIRYGKAAMVRHGDWKLIQPDTGMPELFNLAKDPTEATNLATREPERVRDLRQLLAEQRALDREQIPEDLKDALPGER